MEWWLWLYVCLGMITGAGFYAFEYISGNMDRSDILESVIVSVLTGAVVVGWPVVWVVVLWWSLLKYVVNPILDKIEKWYYGG